MKKATPTEYRGVVFRSKAEAVFARTLDLASIKWEYEKSNHGGHLWDFTIWHGGETLVELKPSMPTMTYVENLIELMRPNPVESILIWGSPWNGKAAGNFGRADCCYVAYPIFSSFSKYGWGDFIPEADCGYHEPYSHRHNIRYMLGITEAMAQEAMRYRFDLMKEQASRPFVLGTKRQQVKLTARRDEPWRLTRLSNVIECLEYSLDVLQAIEELRDDEGFLTCVWKPSAKPKLEWYDAVAEAWLAQNEPIDNVQFEHA